MDTLSPLKTILLTILLIGCQILLAQNSHQVGGMTVSWEFQESQLQFELSAPDDGWVGLGFNKEDDIVGTHLFLFALKKGKNHYEELYVKGVGNPVPVEKMFGADAPVAIDLQLEEGDGKTKVTFSLDVEAYPEYRTSLQKGTELWLICAFSESDDFDHHSRMRKHIRVKL